MRMTRYVIILLVTLTLTSCGGLEKTKMIPGVYTDYVIMEIDCDMALVSAVIREGGNLSLVEFGWIDLEKMVGWTMTNFDWAGFLEKEK
jgi:hypothetical protein